MLFLVLLLLPNLAFADWTCTHHAKIRAVKSWAIYSEPTDAKRKADEVDGEIIAIKDVDGTIAYKVDYKTNLVADDLFGENTECQES